MDEFKSRQKYLSYRIILLAKIIAGLQCLKLIFCGILFYEKKLPGWIFAVSALGSLVLDLLFYGWIVKPYERMEQKLDLLAKGYMNTSLSRQWEMYTSPSGRLLCESLLILMDSPDSLKKSKRQAQYLALQNQINPHFLYNTLESIRSEAMIAGLDSVADMTETLARFFRYTISKVENLVSVEEELENCLMYFGIQQYRFGSRLNLEIICDPEEKEKIYSCRLPKLTLQPILENSIVHGTECKIGTGHLRIYLERTQNKLLIRISDDGIGMDEETLEKLNERLEKNSLMSNRQADDAQGGIALANVNNRIHMLFGEEYGMQVYSMPGKGTDVEINLPMIAHGRELKNHEALL